MIIEQPLVKRRKKGQALKPLRNSDADASMVTVSLGGRFTSWVCLAPLV
jgi:hypothetical protein